jgi:hypothetical protein
LTFNFIGPIVAGVDAGDIGEALWVENALSEGDGAFLDQATDNFAGVRGGVCRWSESRGSKQSIKGQRNAQKRRLNGSSWRKGGIVVVSSG